VPSRNIFITRLGNPNGRHINNEIEILEFLKDYNFEIVDPGKLGFLDQIQLFREARLIVAPHGAALSHIISIPRGARVLEINGDFDVRWHIWKMAKILDIEHYLYLGQSTDNGAITIDIAKFKIFFHQYFLRNL
jgi:capsular polysaccharide biosynthesis protein